MALISPRTTIGDYLVTLLTGINTSAVLADGVTQKYNTNIKYVQRRLKFIDEIESVDGFPSIYLTAGSEVRDYTSSQLTTRTITFILRGYVYDETDSDAALNNLLEDTELAINSDFFLTRLGSLVTDIRILDITTDEGLLTPEGVFELTLAATLAEY